MDTQLVVIDPELLWSHALDDENQLLLEWIEGKRSELTFAVDKDPYSEGQRREGMLLRRYKDYVLEFGDNPNVVSQLVAKWLTVGLPQAKQLNVSLVPNPRIADLVDRHRLDDTEKLMVGLAVNSPSTGLCLLIASRQSYCRRALSEEIPRQAFTKQERKLRVLGASDRTYVLPAVEEENARAHWFEDKVALALTKLFEGATAEMPTPKGVESECGGDIDVWLYSKDADTHKVWIAECKFNIYNQSELVGVNKVKQVRDRIEPVKKYESTKRSSEGDEPSIRSYVVSNAPDMSCDAWKLAAEVGVFFLKAFLSNGYSRKNKWYIEKFEEFEPVEENGRWKGRFIREYSL